ncbi:DEAD/DEAH box helicase [Microlunatus flavus]|uniref:Superfamily II DNA or RNA helicase, SNF2 family n=1 Tax=Microlunatus flavus TaxID=1036181 RepID=A0A1H9GAB8_9ACTN|nr:DEAD/DEAH box helicase [Microlunatus flavus]SEQ47105.1 Superfamily II DNA or RNA helicase, SNF2 family [Microlunatus flavus]
MAGGGSTVGLGDVLSLLRRDAAFDPGTRRRGQEYASTGRVSHVNHEWDGGSLFASGLVNGTVPYRASIVAERAGPGRVELRTTCTCPVAFDCKHVFALVCALSDSLGQSRRPDWRAVLDDVLDEVAPRAAEQTPAVPLGVELVLPKPPARSRWGPAEAALRLWVRPVRRGTNGRWVRRGAEWSRIGTDPYAPAWSRAPEPPQAHPDDLQALAELKSALLGHRGYLGASSDALDLHGAGPGLWRALGRVVERGMPLVASEPEAEVALAEDQATVMFDVRRDDGEVVVSAGLALDGVAYGSADVATIGEPPHGAVLRRRDPSGATRLVLAPLAAPVPTSVRTWIDSGTDLRVDAPAAPELLGEYLPALASSVTVTSRDGSVDIPGPAVVTLRGEATWADDGQVELVWRWLYRRGEQVQQFPVDERPDAVRGWRDRAAEAALVERVRGDEELDTLLGLGLRGPGTLTPRLRLRDVEAMRFAQQHLPRLQAHPDVEVVTNGAPPQFREVTGVPQVQFHPRGAAERKDHTDWLDLEVLVSVEDDELGTVWLGLPTVLKALATGQTVVMLRPGAYVNLDRPELDRLARLVEEARAFADRRSPLRRKQDEAAARVDDEDDVVRINRQAHGLLAEVEEIGATQGQLAEWAAASGALRRLVESGADLPTEPLPAGLRATLRPYQHEGYQWLSFLRRQGLGGVLADDMGLGKTVQTLAMIARAREEPAAQDGEAERTPFLVVVPSSVVATWQSEAERFTPGLRLEAVTSSAARRGRSVAELVAGVPRAPASGTQRGVWGVVPPQDTAPDVVVTTYTLLRLEADAYAAVRWAGLVLDEAQAVKNHRSKTWAALRDVDAGCRFAITGTPLENNLMELWSILSLTAPGIFPYAEAFRTTVAQPIEQHADPDALPALLRRIRPVVLRRTKDLVAADLPPKQVQLVEVTLSPQHRRIYDTHLARERQRLLKLLDDPDGLEQNRITILASLTRLRQLALDPALVDPVHEGTGSAKVDELVARLTELAAEGHRALVFSQFTRFLGRVRARLDEQGIAYAYLDGSTTRRAEVVDAFRRGSAPVFLISLKAGGTGLNLVEADYVFVLDPWWNPAVEAQAVDRTHRIGQTRPVMVYRLVSADTVEQKVVALSARKAELFASVLDGEVELGAALTAGDLAALVG